MSSNSAEELTHEVELSSTAEIKSSSDAKELKSFEHGARSQSSSEPEKSGATLSSPSDRDIGAPTGVKRYAEWGGQTAASLFWIISVFVYGIEGSGDILQLCAALSWFFANMVAFPS